MKNLSVPVLISLLIIFRSLVSAEIIVQMDSVKKVIDRKKLLCTNIAIWNNSSTLSDKNTQKLFSDVSMRMIRIPGGSLSDQYFWNGNGVRNGNNTEDAVDRSKYKNGKWEIDYSSWAPGFIGFKNFPENPQTAELNTWHGNSNIKELIDFVKSIDAEPLICVNAGTGNPDDAAEFVKWANKTMGYNIRYWEIGQELEGEWESGHIRPDGSKMDGSKYANIFISFANAMKKVDSTILVGGPGTGTGPNGFIEDLLKIAGDKVDFISYHTYFDVNTPDPFKSLNRLDAIKKDARLIHEFIGKYQPLRKDKIPIGYTEFNISHTDINTANLFSGLWYTCAIGEMLESGLSFAFQWDAFTQHTENGGGHGYILEEKCIPKAQYWSSYIYNNYFSDTIIATSVTDSSLKVYASKNYHNELYLIVVNTNLDMDIFTNLNIKSEYQMSPFAQAYRLSPKDYKWNPISFQPEWNSGPAKLKLNMNQQGKYYFPAQAVTVIKMIPVDKNATPKLLISGSDRLIVPTNVKDSIRICVSGKGEIPVSDIKVQASSNKSSFKLDKNKKKTDNSGMVYFEIQSPDSTDSVIITFSFKSSSRKTISTQYTVISFKPSLEIIAPHKLPAGTEYNIEINAFYSKDGKKAVFESFPFVCVLEGLRKPVFLSFKNGTASHSIKQIAGITNLYARLDKTDIKSPIHTVKGYEEVEKETVLILFDNESDKNYVNGKGKFLIDNNIRPQQGVLNIELNNYSGWVQDEVNIDKLNSFKSINMDKLTAITFDICLSHNFDSKSQYADLVLSLQGPANWWMPLEKFNLNSLKPGEWKKVRLEIDKPEYKKAVHSVIKGMIIFSCQGPLSGNLYIDNFSFVEKIEGK